jgi:shikimate dehydrogenase
MIDNTAPSITARTSVAAVIGHPVRQSLSPVIHNAGFASTGVDWAYVAIDVTADDLTTFMATFARTSLAGLSVTMPHKKAMAGFMDWIDPIAVSLESINTVVKVDGALHGHSTDGDGLCDALDAADIDVGGASVLLLGAGGASRSIADALVRRSVGSIGVHNRTTSAVTDMLTIAPDTMRPVSSSELAESLDQADIVINATSVGMGSAESPLGGLGLTSRHTVVDIVYHPLETRLLADARRSGCRTLDGLHMLVHQAVRQQVLWTGHTPDAATMIAAAKRALA